jgi:hypothetical protein
VFPTVAPAGFSGTVVVRGAGSVNFSPITAANGVYFLNCCTNTNNSYYKFTGAAIGNIFNINQGKISFYLRSRHSFAERRATAEAPRYAFDVRDGDDNHLFYFLIQYMAQPNPGHLEFAYSPGGDKAYYFVPKGREDALFGKGVALKVTMVWNGSVANLYLNDTLVKSSSYHKPAPSWTAGSNFDLGAYEYLNFGGYDAFDDVLSDFAVSTATSGLTEQSVENAAAPPVVSGAKANYVTPSEVEYGTGIAPDSTPPVQTESQVLLQLHTDASEVSTLTNGSTIRPATVPAGLKGTVVVNGAGAVNFTPAESGNGVYFLNCCASRDNAYYKFTGAALGNIFDVREGEISFYLQSHYSFAERQAIAGSPRFAFDVRDGNNNHLFYFATQVAAEYLEFSYKAGESGAYYLVPQGTEDDLFGDRVRLKVTIAWDGNASKLYLNDAFVASSPYTMPTPNWTADSVFDLGAYEYLTFGGYNSSDDAIDDFTVLGRISR